MGVAFLRNRPEIDPNRIGLAGASQAGWIMPIAATKTQPAYVVYPGKGHNLPPNWPDIDPWLAKIGK